jgi:hypothetical protein
VEDIREAVAVARRVFPAGTAVAALEPFYKVAGDGLTAVRVDNPAEVSAGGVRRRRDGGGRVPGTRLLRGSAGGRQCPGHAGVPRPQTARAPH